MNEASQPLSLVAEAALQLSVEWPDLEKQLLKVVELIRPLMTTTQSVFEGTRALSARESVLLDFGHLLAEGVKDRPLLFVVDTFEEAQYLGFDVVRGIGALLAELQRFSPMLRYLLGVGADLDVLASKRP